MDFAPFAWRTARHYPVRGFLVSNTFRVNNRLIYGKIFSVAAEREISQAKKALLEYQRTISKPGSRVHEDTAARNVAALNALEALCVR